MRYTVMVRERYAANTNVVMHEMFHALGGAHTNTGIMTISLDDPFHNSFVNPVMFQQMIRQPLSVEQQRKVVNQ